MYFFISIIVFFILVFLSGFFSGSETAITSLSKTKIRKIVLQNKSLLKIFSRWLEYPQGLLTTILVGNTIVNISLSAFATITALQLFPQFRRSAVEFATWVSVTILILMFGEILPKVYSRTNPERIAIATIRPLGILNRILNPLLLPVMYFLDLFTPKSAYSISAHPHTLPPVSRITALTVEEIKSAIIDSGKRGGIERETTKMLEGALKLTHIKVKEVMIPKEKIEAVNIGSQESYANGNVLDKIVETLHSRIPVYRGDKNKFTGIVLLKDIVKLKNNTELAKIIRPVYFVNEDQKVSELLHEFRKGKTHCAVVIDSRNNLKGFITLEDILEEIVGEMIDEYELAKQSKIINAN